MALTTDEQALFDEARQILPQVFFSTTRANEEFGMMAKVVGASLTQIRDYLQRQAFIKLADGPTSTTPDWLNQHAIDRGTSRQSGESDTNLRTRLRNPLDMVTRSVLLAYAQTILTADGVAGAPTLIELPRDEVFLGAVVAATGTGGTFTGPTAGAMTFLPTNAFPFPPWKPAAAPFSPFTARSGRTLTYSITFASSTSDGNNGTFATTGLVSNAVTYANGSGVAGADVNTVWTINRKGWDGVTRDGHKHSFLSRGERIGRKGAEIVMILPYGTSIATAKTVAEMLRQKKGGGVAMRVERRANP